MPAEEYVPVGVKEYHPVQALQWVYTEGHPGNSKTAPELPFNNASEVKIFISKAGWMGTAVYNDASLKGLTYMKVWWPFGTSSYSQSGLHGKDYTMMFPGDWAVVYLGNRLVIIPDADFSKKWKKLNQTTK